LSFTAGLGFLRENNPDEESNQILDVTLNGKAAQRFLFYFFAFHKTCKNY